MLEALARLQEEEDAWWEGVEVLVPWAASEGAASNSQSSWEGLITDVVVHDDPAESLYTIEEDPDDEGEILVLSGAELAGAVGFGRRDVRCQCDAIEREFAAHVAENRSNSNAVASSSTGASGSVVAPPAEGGGKRRGRPKGSKNKARATEAAEAADDDGVDPLGLLADELEEAGGTEELKKQTAKLRQGWTYCEYHDDLPDPHLQPERIWQGITHPKLLRRSHDAASGRLRAIETHT